jgi:hypothetical protein
MNLFSIALLIVLLPVIIQIIIGSLTLYKRINFSFGYVCLLTCIGQFLCIYMALQIVAFDAKNQNVRCGMPQAAMFFFGFFTLVGLLITIIIQLLLRRINKIKLND